MKFTLAVALAFAGVMAAADAPQTFTGVITDTMCGAKHTMMKGQPDAECVKACAKGSDGYALYDGKTVWKLSDQKLPAKFPAMKVKVTGVANEKTKTIQVTGMEAAQ